MDFQARPRLSGATLLGIVGAGIAFDLFLAQTSHRFSAQLFVLCFAALPVSLLFLLAGAPVDAHTGERPLWFQIAAGASTLGGLALGLWLMVHVLQGRWP
jgi:hypothetical protein